MKYSYTRTFLGGFLGIVCTLILPFSASAAGISVTTNTPSTITGTSAVLSGNYNTNGNPGGADVRFEWGPTPSLGNTTSFVSMSAGASTFSTTISGLTPSTQYFFRAMANNTTTGPGYGTVLPFTTTGSSVPQVLTMSDTHGTTTATLSGFYNGNGSATTDTQFLWGTNSGTLTNATGFVTQTGASGNFTASIGGLTPNTTYYYRAVAKNNAGTAYANQTLTFKTDAVSQANCVINFFTASPTGLTAGASATLSWSTSNCTSTSISTIGSVVPVSGGSTSTGPINTSTTYTLSASGLAGNTVTKDVTVTTSGTGNGNGCTINSFYASPATIVAGASSTLNWMTTGCTGLSISGIGSVQTSGSHSTGSLSTSQTYTLSGSSASGGFNSSQIVVTVNGTGGGTTSGGGNQYCSINSFSASPTQVASGQSTILSWQTSGCNSVSIQGGTLSGTMPSSYSTNSGPLSGTITYTLYANGSNSVSQPLTVYVTGGPYSYVYACSDGVDNDADGLVDYPSDPGCYSSYDNDETGGTTYSPTNTNGGIITGGNVFTAAANNVSGTSARLNGIVTNSNFQTYGYFEYGTSTSLGSSTPSQFLGGGGTVNFYDTIPTVPNANYFYRAVAQNGNIVSRGSINSFTTLSNGQVSQTGGTSTGTGSSSSTTTTNRSTTNIFNGGSGSYKNGTASANGVLLTVSNGKEAVGFGDKIQYQLTYANQSQSTLKDVVLTIVLPQGFTATQATQGKRVSINTVEVDIGTLTPGGQGSVYLEATVDQNAPRNETLVTTATLTYTLPNAVHDSTVAYVLNHVSGSSSLGGFALGAGFFPTTIFGWLLTILIILAIILFARRIIRGKQNSHSAHH